MNKARLTLGNFDHLMAIRQNNKNNDWVEWNIIEIISKVFAYKLLKQQQQQQYKMPIFIYK